jgi:hypothetical protein
MKNCIDCDVIEKLVKDECGVNPENIVGVYSFGSAVYGTQNENSDIDIVMIMDGIDDTEYLQYETSDIDIHCMTVNHYKTLLNKHNIMALETYFHPSPMIEFKTDFELVLPTLRRSISAVVSNSWVKAKKKVKLENEDSWIGYKSLFHSMRILDYGIQLAEFGKIVDYRRTTPLWFEIVDMVDLGDSIDDIMTHYKKQHNENQTQFRKLAPKT